MRLVFFSTVLLMFTLFSGNAFSLDKGDMAPEFKAVSTQGNVQLSDYKGKKNVVLALYFAVFTPV